MEVGQKIKAVGKETTLYIMSDGWVYNSLQKYTTLILKATLTYYRLPLNPFVFR